MKINHAFLMMAGIIMISAQLFSQQVIQRPKSTLNLAIRSEGGNNGAAVVYNPDKHLYYAVFAGNADYPLETFDQGGSVVSTSHAGNDMRGMWWNPKNKSLEGNCYAEGGIIAVDLDDNGYPRFANEVIFEGGYHQPGEHAVGVYNETSKEILYFNEGQVVGYSRKNGKPGKTFVVLDIPVELSDINWSTMIYTGVKGKEYGLLDYVNKKIYLFERSGGSLTATIQLPAEAVVNDGFNFSYANGMAFLFDKDNRVWTGYRIFE